MSVAHLHAATTLAPRGPPIGTLGGIWPDVVGGAAKAYVLCPTVPWNVCRWQSAVDPLVGCRWVSERAPNHRTTGQKSGRPHIGTIDRARSGLPMFEGGGQALRGQARSASRMTSLVLAWSAWARALRAFSRSGSSRTGMTRAAAEPIGLRPPLRRRAVVS